MGRPAKPCLCGAAPDYSVNMFITTMGVGPRRKTNPESISVCRQCALLPGAYEWKVSHTIRDAISLLAKA